MEFRGQRTTIMGLGHFGGGAAAARWLAQQGALVTVTDLADEKTLADSLAAVADEPIARFHLGGHREEDFRDADLVVVNPAVRPDNRWLEIARQSGALLTSEIELFLRACPASVIGVTGSNGKSTTAAMVASILRADGRRAWLGGNIGRSLLPQLEEIQADDWAVLELSSFQLRHLGGDAPMPQVAVLTNCSPNHLDWHPDYADYRAAKQRILTGQTSRDLAVLNTGDAEVNSWGPLVRGRRLPPVSLDEIPSLPVPGQHNRVNAACAAAAALGAGCSRSAIRRGLESFHALPQRLERLAVIDGRVFYNDSTATTPESTRAAIDAVDEPIWLLLGGGDKGCDFEDLLAAIAEKVRGVAVFGEIRRVLQPQLAAKLELVPKLELGNEGDWPVDSAMAETIGQAFRWCWERSRPGHAIVFSPACPSGGQFRNFRRRGEAFLQLVRKLMVPANRT